MRGVVIGVLLVAAGVALVFHGSLSLDAARERQHALLYSTVVPAFPAVSSRAGITTASIAAVSIPDNSSDAQQQAFLSSASFAFAMDAPVYTSFYLFNVTNGAQVLSGSESPRVHQIGPYVYEKRSRKVNVQLQPSLFGGAKHSTSSTVTGAASTETAPTYGSVSYQVVSSYVFVPARSNGSEADMVVTLNASYARRLTKLQARGYSERLLLAEFAQRHVSMYARHLRHEFLADTKHRAWSHFLPALVDHAQREVLPAVITRQQQRVDSMSIPANLVRMYAVARTEMIPRVLTDVYKDISDQYVSEILQDALDAAKRAALPRVLSNLQQRLLVESVPYWLQQQLRSQHQRHVPHTLASLVTKIESIAFPYAVKELYDRACLDAVPSILRSIKSEIVAQNIAINRVTADDAQRSVVETWRRQDSTTIDFDTWIDDAPTGVARTGFELQPPSASLQLSAEAAKLVLGSKVSNTRFSIVDYDTAVAATYPLGEPTTTPEGFGIWKQVIAMNETAIAYVLQGVNMDVALVSDFLTRDQLLFIREYLIRWATSTITQRDRERLWRQGFPKRTMNSDQGEPSVDLDVEKLGVQIGFSLQPNGATTSGVTASVAQQLWNPLSEFSFVNTQGFTKWQSAVSGAAGGVQTLLDGVTGLTAAHVAEVSAWIQRLLTDGFVKRRALRHWSDGTCTSALGVPLESCLQYDLEPGIAGNQTGFEMNPQSASEWKVPQSLRETLWSRTSSASFLIATHLSNTALGFGIWLRGIRTSDFARVVIDIAQPSLTASNAQGIVQWLKSWSGNELNVQNVHNWWRASTCWEREKLGVTALTTTTTTSLQTCTPLYNEVESTSVLKTEATSSPFFTWEKTFAVSETLCEFDTVTTLYTKKTSTYNLAVRVYSCDASSTSLTDDKDEQTLGFELMPTVTTTGDRISLAAAKVLWDATSAVSFIHVDGYSRWFASSLSAAEAAVMLQSINTEIDATCRTIIVGGTRSGVFNQTLTAAESCGRMTATHFGKIQAYVRAQSSSEWVSNALLDQWRRGVADELELEPYRSGRQRGWELAVGCVSSQCILTQENGTVYDVPRTALSLWDATQQGSFLHDSGWTLWAALSNATAQNDANAIKAAKDDLVTACKTAGWEDWMQRVLGWLNAWIGNEHLLRDVLGHWLHAQCPTAPRLVSVIQRAPDVVSTVSSCPPAVSRYSITLNDSIVDLQTQASRPTKFFLPDIVETGAMVRPMKIVEVDESWTTCESLAPNIAKQTVSSQKSRMEFQACNFLSVLSNATVVELATNARGASFQPLALSQAEASFEMNRSSQSNISIEIALQLWNQSTAFAFTNQSMFLQTWLPAITHDTALAQIQRDVMAFTNAQYPSDLSAVQDYLKMWELSSVTTRRVGIAWLSQSTSVIDLDVATDGIQGGFELFPSGEWKRIAGDRMPTFDQAQILWRADSTFSFLNTAGALTSSGLPTGFAAWKEVYEGVDYSSEQLVPSYPAEAKVQRDAMMSHTLSADQRNALLLEMSAQTMLTAVQLSGIAGWLLNWANNVVLRNYILCQWATGTTPRGETDAFNLADHIGRLFGFSDIRGLPPDLLTVASPLGATVSPTARRNLWDVQKVGSLLNPTTQIVWCTIAASGSNMSSYCPAILNEYGAMSTSALVTYKLVVQPSVQTEITKSSNFTKLSIEFIQRRLEIEEELAVLAIASWWRHVPESSVFFQVNQLRAWRASAASAPVDPLRFGFDLTFVFPINTTVSRNATTRDLVPNVAQVAGSTVLLGDCKKCLELLYALWRPANAMSFLHPTGIQIWRKYFQHELSTLEFVRVIETSQDAMTISALKAASSDDASCLLQATRNWLASWQQHPHLRQFVEFLWFQPLHASSSSSLASPLLAGASDLLRAFPLDATIAVGTTRQIVETDASLQLWANFSRTTLDMTQSASFVNRANGYALWSALLVACSSSDITSGACRNASAQLQYEHDMSTAKVALSMLSHALTNGMSTFDGDSKPPTVASASLETMVTARVVPWMLGWLDHPLFEAFTLQHVIDAEPSLLGEAKNMRDLAMAQFVNASVTRANYSIPTVLSDQQAPSSSVVTVTATTDTGVPSERFARQLLAFDASEQAVGLRNSSILAGFGELKAFCDLNDQDVVFAYDTTTACKLNLEYSVSLEVANALVKLFSDDTPWEWPVTTVGATTAAVPNSTRAALLIDAFLAQPFGSKTECDFVMKNIAVAYSLSTLQIQQACAATTSSGGIYLDLPMLAAAGFASKPLSYTTDVQAYLRYAATRFVYEPSVLGLPPAAFVSRPASSNVSSLLYPIGGYLAAANVSSVLFVRDRSALSGMWRNDSVQHGQAVVESSFGWNCPQAFTVQVPLLDDSALFQKKSRVVGEILAIDDATNVSIWGERVALNATRVTDGSQFTTAILASKLLNGAKDFPPAKLLFYWDYAQRFVEAQFARNVTRFGIPLMRYTVSSWLNPATFPSGLSDAARNSAAVAMVNMSLLQNDLQLALSSAAPLAGESPEVSIDIDPLTGVVYHRRFLWQLSAFVARDTSRNEWHTDMFEGWLSVVWVYEQSSVSSSNGLSLAAVSKTGPFAREKVAVWEVAGGAACILIGTALSFVYMRRQRLLRLHLMQSVFPEQTIMQLKDEHSALTASMSKSEGNEKSILRLRDSNNVETEPLGSDAGSSSSEQLQRTQASSGSCASREWNRTQPRIQAIVEQTDGVGKEADSNHQSSVTERV